MDFLAVTKQVTNIINDTAVADIHTHLYSEAFGDLMLWGIDELLTYHYLTPELLRLRPDIKPRDYFKLGKKEQAELVWQELFIAQTPLSEAARGIVTVLHELGVDTSEKDLGAVRKYFQEFSPGEYIDKVFELANIKSVVMTNDPFDAAEQKVWNQGKHQDERFRSALRLDGLLLHYAENLSALNEQGFAMSENLEETTIVAGRDFLKRWIEKMQPEYMAVSLPPDFRPDDGSVGARLMRLCVLPVAQECKLPFAMMIGVRRRVNPELELAGDGVGKADVRIIEELAREYPDVNFMVTLLSRENQHELCVAARKFRNILPFGCWWFLNNPSIIHEITSERIEMLGLTIIPQHSDARVLDQLIYKWSHSRQVLAAVLAAKYFDVMKTGWRVTKEDIQRDVNRILAGEILEALKAG
jgi:hypothetical protein